MRKIILLLITALSFTISIIWFLNEPGFEPFLAFLSGVMTLLEFNRESNQERVFPERDVQSPQAEEHISRKGTVRVGLRSTAEQRIADELYEYPFTQLRNNLIQMLVLVLCPFLLTAVIIVLNLSDEILIFSWLIFMFLQFFHFTRTMNSLYRQISITGFYSDLKTIAHREKVKSLLLDKKWGGGLRTQYMYWLIWWLLKTDKRQVNRFLKQLT